jgi:transposase
MRSFDEDIATGYTDMRKGFASLSSQVQQVLRHDPLSGQLFCFRGRRGDLLKVIWHDGQGACLFTKRLERGRFLWPSAADGTVTISSAQLGYLLSGIDWRHRQETWRPMSVGRWRRYSLYRAPIGYFFNSLLMPKIRPRNALPATPHY